MTALASVVIPAHNEERGIAATLETLRLGVDADDLEVVVVCNGCTDATAGTVRELFPDTRVIELAEASKLVAMAHGDAVCETFPRIYLDADVQLSGGSVLALAGALSHDGVQAAAPRRVVDRSRCSRPVRWWYDVWEQLPHVRDGLFGRGAYALSEEGRARVSELPPLLNDDLAVSEAFAPDERRVVAAAMSRVVPPRRVADLVQRRTRVSTGGMQAAGEGVLASATTTSSASLLRVCRRRPSLALKLPVFVGVAVVAQWRARRAVRAGDFRTWLRDESSRE